MRLLRPSLSLLRLLPTLACSASVLSAPCASTHALTFDSWQGINHRLALRHTYIFKVPLLKALPLLPAILVCTSSHSSMR